MTIRPYQDKKPQFSDSTYIDQDAVVIGDVLLADDVSIWPTTVLRGDVQQIQVGTGTNIQDGSVCHVTHRSAFNPEGYPLIIGKRVTVGHQATLHACHIGDECLIGMGSLVLDNSELEPQVLLGAGSLVPPNSVLEGGFLWLGRPAKKIRALTAEELAYFRYSAEHYIRLKNGYSC